jgi:hypothetical protein
MDLVVNGPLKAKLRSERCKALMGFFQDWKAEYWQAVAEGTPTPKFSPPKPALSEGLHAVIDVIQNKFVNSAKFTEGLKQAFISVGLSPADGARQFEKYTGYATKVKLLKTKTLQPAEKHGLDPSKSSLNLFSLSDAITEVEMCTRSECEVGGEDIEGHDSDAVNDSGTDSSE